MVSFHNVSTIADLELWLAGSLLYPGPLPDVRKLMMLVCSSV
jgi:hypothetical protein